MGKRHDVEIQHARAAQDARTAVKRGTSRKNIVDEHIFQFGSKASSGNQCKGIFEVGLAGLPVEFRLRTRVHIAPQQLLHASAAHSRQSLRQQETLIKATLPGFARVQGTGTNTAPATCARTSVERAKIASMSATACKPRWYFNSITSARAGPRNNTAVQPVLNAGFNPSQCGHIRSPSITP